MSNNTKNSKKNSLRPAFTNRNAAIETRIDRTGKIRTETVNRDNGTVRIAVSTTKSDATNLYIEMPSDSGKAFRIDGRTARTIYRTLQKHYQNTNKNY